MQGEIVKISEEGVASVLADTFIMIKGCTFFIVMAMEVVSNVILISPIGEIGIMRVSLDLDVKQLLVGIT